MSKLLQDSEAYLHKLCRGKLRNVQEYVNSLDGEALGFQLNSHHGVLGYTPLHVAVANSKPDTLDFLVAKGGDVNCRANCGYTPLHLATSSGHAECVAVLIRHNADVGAKDEFGKTPRHTAELSSKSRVIKLLRSDELIKEVERGGDNLAELLHKYRTDQLEQDCLPRALLAAVRTNNQLNVGKLIVKGPGNIDEALELAKTLRKHAVWAVLLLVKSAMTGDCAMVQKLFQNPAQDTSNRDIIDTNIGEMRNLVASGEVSTVVPIQMARFYNHASVRAELLLRTNVNQDEGSVYWSDLRLIVLEVSWLRNISWVKRLRLARNKFRSLPNEMGTYLHQLVKLDLSHNDLTAIPRCILELPSLLEVNLQHNKLTSIPSVPEWSSCLTVLDLSHNRLSGLPSHVVANSIRTLNLNDNNLHSVPLCICSLVTLYSLDLSNNPHILSLPAEMGRLSRLSRLNIDGLNDLSDPPRNVQTDTRSCIIYLNNKLRCAKGFYRMKLMLVGKQNRGKTTLVARLQGKDCGNQSTVGVDVSEWEYRPGIGKRLFYFSIWDFGGQEEYYTTHQCFLSQRSLYILAFNLLEGSAGVEELKPWLNNISLRVPDSCVIIVGTHLDEVADEDREKVDSLLTIVGELAMQYDKLKVSRVMAVGLKNKIENVALLKNTIYETAANYSLKNGQLLMGQKVPASYHALDKHMGDIQCEIRASTREPVMHVEEFKTMVYKMNLGDIQDEEELKVVTSFLTDVGSLLHYNDRGHNLHELYFIDPRWLCNMMSKVITIRERNPFVCKGILRSKYIPHLFKDERFPWKYFEQYLALLDRFEIALPLNNKHILIPSMLPTERPDITKEMCSSENGHLCFTRYITFAAAETPPGFWSRLLSRIMHLVPQIHNAINKQLSGKEDKDEKSKDEECRELVSVANPAVNDKPPSASSSVPIGFPSRSISSVSMELPNFQSALPLSGTELPSAGNIMLLYWRTGIYYKDPDLLFLVESLAGSPLYSGKRDGILVVASPTSAGKKVISQLVDMVLQLVEEWYPGLQDAGIGRMFGTGIEQRVPCMECAKLGVPVPYEFKVETCLTQIAANKVSIKCLYYRDDPSKCHEVSLAEIVPDLLLHDIEPEFILKPSDVLYDEEESSLLGVGGFGKVYRGSCKNKSVAIKKYLTHNEEAFTELRREATLLHKHHHPCLVCLVGVCVHPSTMLVLELAPMGSLERPLIKKKQVVHRVTIHRIAAQVAAALRFLHSNGIIFRDLKAANVLLWTLDPASLCHCKLTDFGIVTHLGAVGAKSLHGTKGFIAPEVLHIGKKKEVSVYNHQADVFSYGMFLYQMIACRHPFHDIPPVKIDSAVVSGERPKLHDVPQASCGLFYLTRLMRECWHDNPSKRVATGRIIRLTSLSSFQSVLTLVPVISKFSLRHACAAVLSPASSVNAGKDQRSSKSNELWVCCDGAKGAEINIFTTNAMAKSDMKFIEGNQVQCMALCGNHIWVGSRPGMDYGVIDIYSAESHKSIHNIKMKEDTISCITCSASTVYCGTLEGNCFAFSKNIKVVKSNKYLCMCVSESAVDGIVATRNHLWVSQTRFIHFLNLETLMLEGSVRHHASIGHLALDASGTTVWSVYLGATTVSAWDVLQGKHNWDIDVIKQLRQIDCKCSEQDAGVTAMTPVLDTVWVGMTSGYILVFHEEQMVTWYCPYMQYVRFLEPIYSGGPCQSEACMVLSGGKEFNTSMIKGLKDHEEKCSDDAEIEESNESGTMILWEAFPAKMLMQMKLVEDNSSDCLLNHQNLQQIVYLGDFKDGTHLLQKGTDMGEEEVENTCTSDTPDSDSLVYPATTGSHRRISAGTDSMLLITQKSSFSQRLKEETEEEEKKDGQKEGAQVKGEEEGGKGEEEGGEGGNEEMGDGKEGERHPQNKTTVASM